MLVTLRAATITAGVVGEDLLPAVIALIDVASKERRAAGGNIPKGPLLDRAQGFTELLAVCRAVEADNVSHLQHEDPGIRGRS